MNSCIIGLIEDWQLHSLKAGHEAAETYGLSRLQQWDKIGGEKGNNCGSVVQSLLTRLEAETGARDLASSPHLSSLRGEHLLSSFDFLCHRLWSPLPHFLQIIFSCSSVPPSHA